MTVTQSIEMIVIDLDGTLLNSKHELSERTEKTIKAAIEQGIHVVIATGKTRLSATEVINRLGLETPGIYLQGLTIYKPDGSIIYQKVLDPEVARQVITFAEDRGFAMVAYSGSRILVRSMAPGVEQLSTKYHEPMPEEIGPLQNILDEMPINKLMAIKYGEPQRINALRWQLQMQLDGKGRLVQAMIPDMLEILPPGTSKGVALKALLKEMNIPAEKVLALGDGENDIEMIEMAGIGVAVGNADEKLKRVADYVVASSDDDGVAEAIERFVLKKREEDATSSAESGAEENDNTVTDPVTVDSSEADQQ